MKITLQVNGREMSFSEEQLTAILETHFPINKVSENSEDITVPTEGEWFEVVPLAINQELFQIKREDENQERTRQLIVEAFTELNNNPGKYGRVYETMMPEIHWDSRTVGELNDFAINLGYRIANHVEVALEWAQRISNGETWEDICNKPDIANCQRLVDWKDGFKRCIGGSCKHSCEFVPASYIGRYHLYPYERLINTVPLIVRYK